MKRKIIPIMVISLAAIVSASCAFKTVGDAADYYEVSFYTDFAGIDYKDPDCFKDQSKVSKAKYLGKGFFKKSLSNLNSSEQEKISEVRITDRTNAAEGVEATVSQIPDNDEYRHVFETFVGYYSDGKPVVLNNITENCSVFAKFNLEKMKYLVRIFSSPQTLEASETVEYGTLVGDIVSSVPDNPDHDPLKENDAYYMNYTFLGYQGTYYDKNDDEQKTAVFTPEELLKQKIVNKITYAGVYNDGFYKDYTITFVDENHASLGSKIYEWGKKIDNENLPFVIPECSKPNSSPDMKWVFDHWEGQYDVDHISDKRVVTALMMAGLDGKPVNFSEDYVRYDCEIHPVYKEVKKELTLTFYIDKDHTKTTEMVVDYGQEDVKAPVTDTFANYMFTGYWEYKDDDGNFHLFDFKTEQPVMDMTLYPYFVEANPTFEYQATGKVGGVDEDVTVTVTLDYDDRCLYDINEKIDEETNEKMFVKSFGPGFRIQDVVSSNPDALFPLDITKIPYDIKYVSIKDVSLTDATKVNSIKLSDSVVSFNVNSTRGIEATEIDLRNSNVVEINSLAFSYANNLTSLKLPHCIKSLGRGIVQGCEKMNSIYVDLTADEYVALKNSVNSLISTKWNYIDSLNPTPLTFKS